MKRKQELPDGIPNETFGTSETLNILIKL